MKSIFYNIVGLLLFWGLLSSQGHASHELGATISYECLNSCTTRVNLLVYRFCPGLTTIANTVTWSSTSCSAPPSIGPMSALSMNEVSPICPAYPTGCNLPSATIPGVQEYHWYRDFNTCAVPGCVYTLRWSDCCRSSNITSLQDANTQGISTNDIILNTSLGSCNNSPVYTNYPLFYACAGLDYDVHQGAFDLDGDSLVFSIESCYGNTGAPVTYNPGYSPTSPLGNSWVVTLNSQTGMLHLDANPGNLEVGVLCVKTTEYRNGNFIGSTTRDIQIQIMSCGNNSNPTVSPISNLSGATTSIGDDIFVSGSVPICFDLNAMDADSGQSVRLWWDDNSTSATFTEVSNGANQDTINGAPDSIVAGRFCWTPPASGDYPFKFRVQDDYCPIYGFSDRVVTIHVDCPGTAVSATVANCLSVNFAATPCMGGNITYAWSGAGGFVSSVQNPSYVYPTVGNFPWQVIVTNGVLSDTVTGVISVNAPQSYLSIFSGLHFVAPCAGVTYDTLDAGNWATYLWNTGATSQTISAAIAGTYSVTVTDSVGCIFHDSTEITWGEPDIYGLVTASNGTPLQNQRILLIQHDTTLQALWAVDSAWTDPSGYYFFCDVLDTLVYLKATPLQAAYPNEMPTYADSTLYWNGALQFLGVLQSPFRHDFNTLFGINPGGPGFIGGLITQGANKTTAVGDPIIGLTVFLRNFDTGAILGYRTTDANGYFEFANIPLGNYEIIPDRPLVSTTNVPYISLVSQSPAQYSLNFFLHRYWLELDDANTGIGESTTPFLCHIYPNPFSTISRLLFELQKKGSVQVHVYDIMGRCVAQVVDAVLAKGQHSIDFGTELGAGVYFVRIAHGSELTILKVVKE